jgi:hypothetical protein
MERPKDLSRWGLNNWGNGESLHEEKAVLVADLVTQYFRPIKGECIFNSSYGLKHVLEKCLETYISNGELIAGMIMAGFTIYRVSKKSPNCYFNLDPKSVLELKRDFGI